MSPEDKDIWKALQGWLSTDEAGREIIHQLKTNQSEIGDLLDTWLRTRRDSVPPTLTTIVSGGKIEKIVNIARAGVVLISQPKTSGPTLSLPRLILNDRTQLNYAARRTQLIGRDSELKSLERFLDDDRPFCWWAMTGPAGVGKSRLALDFCLQVVSSWKSGFMPKWSTFTNWDEWQPTTPTLVVVDYAANRMTMLRAALLALSQRLDGEKIRFLLLERTSGDYWWKDLLGYGTDRHVIEQSLYAEPLGIPLLLRTEVERIVEDIVAPAIMRTKGKNFFKEIHQLGFIDRPLFAALVAEAINSGRDPRELDRERLVCDVLDREVQLRWIPGGLKPHDISALILATILGGLNSSLIEDSAFAGILPSPEAFDVSVFEMATGGAPRELIEPLEPDVVGELFVLEQLSPKSSFHRKGPALIKAAWTISPEEVVSFLSRTSTDFPDHVTIGLLFLEMPDSPEHQYYWALMANKILRRLIDAHDRTLAVRLCKLLLTSRFQHPAEKLMRTHYGDEVYEALFNVEPGTIVRLDGPDAYGLALYISDLRLSIGTNIRTVIVDLLEKREFDTADNLTFLYQSLIESHPYDHQSVLNYVWAAIEHIYPKHVVGKTAESIDWYHRVSVIADARRNDAIWDARQKGLVNLIYVLCDADRMNDAIEYSKELNRIWSDSSQQLPVGERVREATILLCAKLAQANRFDDCERLLESARELLVQRKDPSILIGIAECLGDLATRRAESDDMQSAYRMLNSLRGLKGEKADEGPLRTIQAMTIYNLMIFLSRGKSHESMETLYIELKQIDQQAIASQSLLPVRTAALCVWLCAAYQDGSRNSLEHAYAESRTFAILHPGDGSTIFSIGGRLLAAIVKREGDHKRACELIIESGKARGEEAWSSVEPFLGASTIQEIRRFLAT